MARVSILDKDPFHAATVAMPLREAGHCVQFQSPRTDLEAVAAFAPAMVIAALYRDRDEVRGLQTLINLQQLAFSRQALLVVVGHGVEDLDVDPVITYDVYLACRADAMRCLPLVAEICLENLSQLGALSPADPITLPPREPTDLFGIPTGVVIRWGASPLGT